MLYEFECPVHGRFEVNQPIMAEHKANCPKCGQPAKRVYFPSAWLWTHPQTTFNRDGSYRERG